MAYTSITKRYHFTYVRNKGLRWFSAHFMVQALHDEKQVTPLLGLTVSKKVGNAVKRNRIKRRLRAAWVAVLKENFLVNGLYVLIPKPSLLSLSFSQLQELLLKSLRWVCFNLTHKSMKQQQNIVSKDVAGSSSSSGKRSENYHSTHLPIVRNCRQRHHKHANDS